MKLKIVNPLSPNDYYVLDGGFSTQLSRFEERREVSENKNSLSSFRYVNNVDTDPLWTARSLVTNPEAVRKVHTDFLAAGARIVLTCSYQVSVNLFKEELNLTRAQTREHIGSDELSSSEHQVF